MATSGFARRSTSNRHVSHLCTDRFQQRFDPALRDPTRDEDDAAAAVIRRPTLEPGGCVKDSPRPLHAAYPDGRWGDPDRDGLDFGGGRFARISHADRSLETARDQDA